MKIPKPRGNRPRCPVRVRVGGVPPPPNAGFHTRMATAACVANRIRPHLRVSFQKPIHGPVPPKLKRLQTFQRVRLQTVEGILLQWGGIPLVCHRSPYHDSEWIVSEYTTGRNIVSFRDRDGKHNAGQNPSDHEARFAAIYYLQSKGLTAMRAAIAALPKLNRITPEMTRHVQALINQQVEP